MFEDSLLESSIEDGASFDRASTGSSRLPSARSSSWHVYFVLPMVSANETSVIVTQSAIVACGDYGFALILCYVLADCQTPRVQPRRLVHRRAFAQSGGIHHLPDL